MAQTKIEQGLLKFTEATDFVKLPSGTTAQRPGSPAAGQFRFNTTIGDAEVYDGTAWQRMGIAPPTFSSVDYPGNDTALDPAGDQSLVINGTAFNPNVTVTIGGTTPSSITRNSATQLTVNTPAKAAGTYTLVIENTDGGTATASNAVSYNGVPAFTNAAGSLGGVNEGDSMNFSVAATEPDGGAITYAITAGGLPSGASLNTSTGAITGTSASVSATTTSNFTITATDNENQSTARAYSITVTKVNAEDNFNTVTWTGNGTTQNITGLGFQPDIVWVKERSGTNPNSLFDSTRGAGKLIKPALSGPETGNAGDLVGSFDTNGFQVNRNYDVHTAYDNTNYNGSTYVAWCWKVNGGTTSTNNDGSLTTTVQANPTIGISIVKYDMSVTTSTAFTLGHGLGIAPKLILFFSLEQSGSTSNMVYPNNPTKELTLDNSGSFSSATSGYWNSTAPSSTVINMGGSWGQYHSYYGGDSVAYCFADVAGLQKIDSYTGNGSTSGPLVVTGFEPAFLMVKRTDSNDSWIILDNKRDTANPRNNSLKWDEDGQEEIDSSNRTVDFLSNGFQIKTTHQGMNANNGTYLYLAIAANGSATTPTLADSFNTVTYTGTGSARSITGLGFKPNLVWSKGRSVAYGHILNDSLRGISNNLTTNNTDAQSASTIYTSLDSDGYSLDGSAALNQNSATYVAWSWKADDNEATINTGGSIDSLVSANANAGFSVVKYVGNGSSGSTIGHGLSAAPELIIAKNLQNTTAWGVYVKYNVGSSGNPASERLTLQTTDATTTTTAYWGGTEPTSSVFTVGTENAVNQSGYNTIAYCFTSIAGFSKIGSYTGNAGTQTITTGFQPNFIVIKKSSGTGTWRMFDSVRGTDKSLRANDTAAEYDDTQDYITFISTGFSYTNQTNSDLNENNSTYIYMAFKIN